MPEEELLSFALDRYNVYPSEAVSLHVRPNIAHMPAGTRLQLALPAALQLLRYRLLDGGAADGQRVSVVEHDEDILLQWEWPEAGPARELVVLTRVRHTLPTSYLAVQAALMDADGAVLLLLEQRIFVRQMAQMMNYMPEIHHDSDFINRFLMLFESFWQPINERNDAIHEFFNPHLTPASFLPWLGSWFGLVLDEELPEERQRSLLAQIAPIFAARGTRQSLVDFLRLYTGGEVSVVEHMDENLVLGDDTCLGYSVALGTELTPQSFDVSVRLPPNAAPYEPDSEMGLRYRRRLEALIATFQPAHTVFHLELQPA